MNKTIIIANWKMNLNPADSQKLAEEIINKSSSWSEEKVEVVLCPSFVSISQVSEKLFAKGGSASGGKGSKVMLGAQDCFWEDQGSFTGEVSPKVLKEFGCRYVIVGHSERRQNLGETGEQVNKKVRAVLRNDLIPIICVGETFEERQEGQKDQVVMSQVNKALLDIKLLENDQLIVAYEPVWVIGSGQAVAPEEAEHTSRVIRQVLLDNFSQEGVSEKIRIIYGGSVNPNNVNSFFEQPTIDGILVGGASLDAETFVELIKQCK